MEKNSRSELLPLEENKFETTIEIDIAITKFLASNEIKCDKNGYDQCIRMELRKQLASLCHLPFMEPSSAVPKCSNFEEGLRAFNIFNAQNTNCSLPCTQTNVGTKIHPSQFIYSFINPNIKVSENPGYRFSFPKLVHVTEMTEDYDVVSYIAEFGGWAGLFVGMSILGLYSMLDPTNGNKVYFKQTLSASVIKFLKITFEFTLYIALIFLFCYVCFTSFSKLLEGSIENNIGFMKKYPNAQLSICSEESMYDGKTYVGSTKNFWINGSNIANKLYILELTFKNGSMGILRTIDQSGYENTYSHDQLHMQNVLTSEMKVEFCQTFDVSNVKSIKIIALAEIFLYLHLDKQLWGKDSKTRITTFPKQSVYIKKSKPYLSNTFLRLKFTYNYNVQEISNNVDDCITSGFPDENNLTNIIRPSSLDNIQHGIEEERMRSVIREFNARKDNHCPSPNSYIRANYEFETLSYSTPLEIHNSTSKYSRGNVYLVFPEFSMFNKVSHLVTDKT